MRDRAQSDDRAGTGSQNKPHHLAGAFAAFNRIPATTAWLRVFLSLWLWAPFFRWPPLWVFKNPGRLLPIHPADCSWPGSNAIKRNLKVAHVGDINRPAQALLFVVGKRAGVSFGEQVAVGKRGSVRRGRQSGILLLRHGIFLPGCKGIVADKK